MPSSGEFSCSFDNIRNYPFGVQNCSFRFFLKNAVFGKLTPTADTVSYSGPRDISQYVVKGWQFECHDGTAEAVSVCRVSLLLKRLFRAANEQSAKFSQKKTG